ncbi:membrane protein implicated in regulation of membrane protease activity [Parabacteroides sp. PF5-5]|uniref:hypothetical protein n=1 Tax=unclassified Parabacteroides TaxID=2649774 RepID=UPI002475A507|nr:MULTISPECIES: hypothetical protein [unclassified Parabacteroides]MDH6306693.1 membrane protein implicated in regulation of membrane protease activity [Parabacteroides sp. PH5-39]MDH6317911.1 membrane protein implicated in regulation of membrane protease activity [Parabacteroides sp. PF5-13]MDH6321455.1 membrane protein implicated in regulation of membrane protease activity [Parabacteroides sp. PH5-13]MDH6325186.1 membrane protein implicated in regulation of membrane protease activity [Paraba
MIDPTVLGQSQTFFGVLTTLVVLCAVFCDSNFLNNIIEGLKSDMKARSMNNLNSCREEFFQDIKNTKEKAHGYKKILAGWGSTDNKDIVADAIDKFELENILLENDVINTEKEIDTIFESNTNMSEQIFTPLYVFIFCLVVFLCDESISLLGSYQNWMPTFLYIFVTFSFALCFLLWFFYMERSKADNILNIKKEDKIHLRSNSPIKVALFDGVTFLLLFSALIAIYATFSLHFNLTEHVYAVSVFVFSFISVLLISFTKIKSYVKTHKEYTRMFIFRHFIFLLVASVFFTFLIAVIYYLNIAPIYPSFFTESVLLKNLLIVFALLNGIILPFILQIISYSRHKKYIDTKIEAIKNRVDQSKETLANDLNAELEAIVQQKGKE